MPRGSRCGSWPRSAPNQPCPGGGREALSRCGGVSGVPTAGGGGGGWPGMAAERWHSPRPRTYPDPQGHRLVPHGHHLSHEGGPDRLEGKQEGRWAPTPGDTGGTGPGTRWASGLGTRGRGNRPGGTQPGTRWGNEGDRPEDARGTIPRTPFRGRGGTPTPPPGGPSDGRAGARCGHSRSGRARDGSGGGRSAPPGCSCPRPPAPAAPPWRPPADRSSSRRRRRRRGAGPQPGGAGPARRKRAAGRGERGGGGGQRRKYAGARRKCATRRGGAGGGGGGGGQRPHGGRPAGAGRSGRGGAGLSGGGGPWGSTAPAWASSRGPGTRSSPPSGSATPTPTGAPRPAPPPPPSLPPPQAFSWGPPLPPAICRGPLLPSEGSFTPVPRGTMTPSPPTPPGPVPEGPMGAGPCARPRTRDFREGCPTPAVARGQLVPPLPSYHSSCPHPRSAWWVPAPGGLGVGQEQSLMFSSPSPF